MEHSTLMRWIDVAAELEAEGMDGHYDGRESRELWHAAEAVREAVSLVKLRKNLVRY